MHGLWGAGPRQSRRAGEARSGSTPRTLGAFVAAALLAVAYLAAPTVVVRAVTPEPAASAVVLTAEPLLGGNFRRGSWAAFRVTLTNSGPAVEGDLRVTTSGRDGSSYRLPVQLAPGAHQEHFLYAPVRVATRYDISLRQGDAVLATTRVTVQIGDSALAVSVVAERPDALAGSIRDAADGSARFANVRPEDLPPRVEPWSSVDLLVWQDVDAARLDEDRRAALRAWLATGGNLVILAGSTGTLPFAGLPADILPFKPSAVVDVSRASLEAAFGQLPDSVTGAPALSGQLERGTVLLQGRDTVFAARAPHGQGSVTIVAVDPRTPWLAQSQAGAALWKMSLPRGASGAEQQLPGRNEFLVAALASLPTVQLPRSDHLLILMLAYMITVGPVNYMVLRRRDRRELAWLTIPLTILVFAVAAYGFGVVLRGSAVVVNELGVVQGATGANTGIADVHVGVFSPDRRSFNVRVEGRPLVAGVTSTGGGPDGGNERPLDVVMGDHAILPGFEVGFGALRAFRAHSMVDTPRVESNLALVEERLTGTISNAADVTLNDVSVVYGEAFVRIGQLAPGETREIDLVPVRESWPPLWERLYPPDAALDAEQARHDAARRAVIQHLHGGGDEWGFDMEFQGSRESVFRGSPVVLAWASEPLLSVDVGVPAEQMGETLYVLAARAAARGRLVLSGGLLHTVALETEATEFYQETDMLTVSGGTVTLEYRPVGLDAEFDPETLALRLASDGARSPSARGDELLPLPSPEQPDQDRPLASDPRGAQRDPTLPRVQLLDLATQQWIEMEPMDGGRTYLVPNPERYVNSAGAFRARLVVGRNEWVSFALTARLVGVAR